jgi:hypothetical protein
MTALASVRDDRESVEHHVRNQLAVLRHLAELEPESVDVKRRLLINMRAVLGFGARRGDADEGRALTSEARAVAEELLAWGAASVGLLQDYARLLNEAYPEEMRDTAEAIRICSLAAERTGNKDVATLRLLADLQVADGQRNAAIEALEQALSCPGTEDVPVQDAIQDRLASLKPLSARARSGEGE